MSPTRLVTCLQFLSGLGVSGLLIVVGKNEIDHFFLEMNEIEDIMVWNSEFGKSSRWNMLEHIESA